MRSLLPEKPILLYPSLAATIGLEEATLLSLLDNLADSRQISVSQGYTWYQLKADELHAHCSFWDQHDIQRISQRLRDLGLILIKSAPFVQSQLLEFAFNHPVPAARDSLSTQQSQRRRYISPGASPIAATWKPDQETYIALGQLNVPEHFAREQIPEFVRYWRENGDSQRSWSSKFIQYTKRQWAFHTTQLARQNRATPLPHGWQPSTALQQQIAAEGIPATFANKVLNKFCLYHRNSGTTHINWDMPFLSWVKEEWQQQDTPFIESKKSTPIRPDWLPDKHTVDYLNVSQGIDYHFIEESIPEFIHKWTEKKAIYSEWGRIFAEHVIEQWRFVQLGIKQNKERRPIVKDWRPSGDCLEILEVQSGVSRRFIEAQISEFILYWTNRAEPMYSWDNIFLRHIKREWELYLKGISNERQQNDSGTRSTREISLEERLTDTSWAN
ncbi:MAG: DnaT-like ssDNA-binding domain-containing protein [Pseudomonadota bacterium]